MADADGSEDVESYILSSKYRSRVLEYLAGTAQATPKEIAESVDVPRPHVSRALSELQEKGVVELRVSEARSVGRYYGLTEKGGAAWPEIKNKIRSVNWTIENPSTPATRSIVEFAENEFGEGVRCVGIYEGTEVTIFYADPEVLSSYSDDEFEEALRTLIFDHSLDELNMPKEDCWSDVLNFNDFSVIRVRVKNGSRVSISFDRDQNVSVPEFTESIASIFET